MCLQTTSGEGEIHRYSGYEGFLNGAWKKDVELTADMDIEQKRKWYREESNLAAYLVAQEKGFSSVVQMMEEELPDWSEEEWETRIEQLRDIAGGISLYRMMERYNYWCLRIDYMESYPEFLQNIQKKADSMQALSLFSDPDSFSQQHILNAAEEYKKLEDLKLEIEYSPTCEVATDSFLTDIMALILVWVLAWIMFFQEKTNGFYPMLRSTKNGRSHLMATKLIAFFIAIGIIGIALYASQIVLAYILYGAGGEQLALQSIESFRNSVWTCSIGQYIGRFLLTKIVAMLAVGSLMMVVFSNGIRFALTSCISFGILGIEWFWYHWISEPSKWNLLKYVNLFYLQDVKEQARNYIDLNIASNAVPANKIVWIVSGVLMILFAAITIGLFSRERGRQPYTRKWLQKTGTILQKTGFWYRTTSVQGQEAGKLYRNCQACFVIAVLIVFSWKNADGIPQYQVSSDRNIYQNYIEKYQGYYTEEIQKQLEEEQKYFQLEDQEAVAIEQKWQNQMISEEEYEQWQKERQWGIMAREGGFERFWSQVQLVKEVSKKTEKAGFVDQDQFSYLLEDDGRQIVMAVILLTIVCVFSCTLFGMEYTTGMERLLHSTCKGRKKLFRAKLIQLIGVGTILFAILYVPYEWMIIKQIERVPYGVALMSVPDYAALTLPLEIGQAVWLTLVLRYVTMLLVILVSVGITRVIKHTVFSIAVCILLFVVPCFLLLIGVDLTTFTCAGGMFFEIVLRSL